VIKVGSIFKYMYRADVWNVDWWNSGLYVWSITSFHFDDL